MDTQDIKNSINLNIKDNETRDITPQKVRKVLNDVLDGLNEGKVDKVADKGLSTEDYTSAEKTKLAGLESSKFLGTFINEAALPATASEGNYAYVDAGAGHDVAVYIWDVDDEKFVKQGASSNETSASIKQKYESNPDTNAFTDADKTKLSNALTEHQNISGKEDKSNKKTNLENADNATYPTTLAVKTAIENIDGGDSTDTLQDVVDRGYRSNKSISFIWDGNTDYGAIGGSSSNWCLWFGSKNAGTGTYNISMGILSGSSFTTGESNTFIGGWSGSSTTTGSHNTFVGVSAGSANTTGSHNTFVGVSAGSANTTGSHNTFVGVSAGKEVKGAKYSVALGIASAMKLKANSISYSDLNGIMPVLGTLNSDYYLSSNALESDYDLADGIFPYGMMNSLCIGQSIFNAANANYVNRSAFSVNIGSQLGGNLAFRDYNNIRIGNFQFGNNTTRTQHNSIVIGNFIRTNVNLDNHFAIHNSKSTITNVDSSLIFGKFDDRWLKINGNLRLNPTYNKVGDSDSASDYNKVATAKADGSVALQSIVEVLQNCTPTEIDEIKTLLGI